jgi:PAS domain S-box-containing protein
VSGALEAEAAGFEAFCDRLSIALVRVDPEGRIVRCNVASERLLGYEPGELLGRDYEMLLPPERAGELRKALDKVKRGRRVPALESERLGKGGATLDVVFSVFELDDPGGGFAGAWTTLTDISRERQAQRRLKGSAAQVEAIVSTVLDGIVMINAQGVVEAVNPAAERIFGYRAHELIGKNVNVLMPEPTRTEHDGYLEHYLRTREARVIGIGREVTGRRKDGSTFPVDLAVAEMRIGGASGFVGVLRDITERKEAETAQRRLNDALGAKVNELNDTLAQLRLTQDPLVEAEQLASLGALVAGVAHEINTPVGICVTAASFLNDESAALAKALENKTLTRQQLDGFVARSAEAAKLVVTNSLRASELIRSFKQVAVDRSASEKRQFRLREFLDDLLTSLRPALRQLRQPVTVDCPADLSLHTYPGSLAQVVTNLVVNASTHAFADRPPGSVRIRASADRGWVEIEVADDGIGIAPEHVKHVFDPFFTTARGRGGTGLGLHVAWNLVTQALGGRITVASEPGQGARFSVRIPIDVTAASAAHTPG